MICQIDGIEYVFMHISSKRKVYVYISKIYACTYILLYIAIAIIYTYNRYENRVQNSHIETDALMYFATNNHMLITDSSIGLFSQYSHHLYFIKVFLFLKPSCSV